MEVREDLGVGGALGVFEELAAGFGGGVEIEDGVGEGDGAIDLPGAGEGFECRGAVFDGAAANNSLKVFSAGAVFRDSAEGGFGAGEGGFGIAGFEDVVVAAGGEELFEGDVDHGGASAVPDRELIEELDGAPGVVEVLIELIVLKNGSQIG